MPLCASFLLVLALATGTACAVGTSGDAAHAGESPTLAQRVEAWVRSKRKDKYFSAAPGISVLTVDPVSGPHVFGDGVRQLGQEGDADADTLYEIGSLSKTMTALGLAAVAAKGVLAFEDPVQKWLGPGFKLGPHEYVSATVTVKDLMAHRTGLGQGQGDFIGGVLPARQFIQQLAFVDPVHTLRDVFDYSNTGWMLAGEVLRSATNSSSWCSALRISLLDPLGLNATFCSRNEMPVPIATAHLAGVHKHDPCGPNGPEGLANYSFLATGGPADYAWGAADAAGSVISSVRDMAEVINLLVNRSTSSPLLPRELLDTLMSGEMVVSEAWMRECGIATAGYSSTGRGNAAGLGFDIACEISPLLSAEPDPSALSQPYAEKNGDTNMHKARMGLLTAAGSGTLLLSNLGGSMGCQLTALKFGVLALLAGGTEDDADLAAERSLNTTNYVKEQWIPGTTCTPCGRSAASGPCNPAGSAEPPFALSAVTGKYASISSPFGDVVVGVTSTENDGQQLTLSVGPVQNAALVFSNTSAVGTAPCAALAANLPLEPWAAATEGQKLAGLPGLCSVAEFVLPPEIRDAGVSADNGTVAFPWGCGLVPLPDGPQIFVVSHNASGVLLAMVGEAMWVQR